MSRHSRTPYTMNAVRRRRFPGKRTHYPPASIHRIWYSAFPVQARYKLFSWAFLPLLPFRYRNTFYIFDMARSRPKADTGNGGDLFMLESPGIEFLLPVSICHTPSPGPSGKTKRKFITSWHFFAWYSGQSCARHFISLSRTVPALSWTGNSPVATSIIRMAVSPSPLHTSPHFLHRLNPGLQKKHSNLISIFRYSLK